MSLWSPNEPLEEEEEEEKEEEEEEEEKEQEEEEKEFNNAIGQEIDTTSQQCYRVAYCGRKPIKRGRVGVRLRRKLIRIKVLVVPSKRYGTQFAQNVTRRQRGVHRSQFNLGYWYQGHLNNSGHSGKP